MMQIFFFVHVTFFFVAVVAASGRTGNPLFFFFFFAADFLAATLKLWPENQMSDRLSPEMFKLNISTQFSPSNQM